MSLPRDTERDPRADALLTSALSAADGVEASGCPDAEVIGLYAERELAGAELRAVEAHVHACPRCQATVAALVRALPDAAAEAAGAVSGAGEASAGGGFAAWFAGWRWLVPAASLTAVALVAVWVGRGPADEVVESAKGAAAMVATDAPAPAAEVALGRRPEAFVPQPGASESAPAGAAMADRRAPSPARVEARREVAGKLADRAATANTAPSEKMAAAGALREVAAEAAPAAAPVQETLTVTEAPPAPAAPASARPAPAAAGTAVAADAAVARARTATFGAVAFAPWRAVNGRVERSRDDGATWERVATPEGVRVIAAGSPGGDICWLVTDDGVLRTTNGRTWMRTTRPTSEPLAAVVSTSADRASVSGASGRRWETTDGGRTWVPAP